MTQREHSYLVLAVGALAAFVVLGGGWWLYRSWADSARMLADIQQKTQDIDVEIKKVNDKMPQLDRWRRLSLPPNTKEARDKYQHFLIETMKKTGVRLE